MKGVEIFVLKGFDVKFMGEEWCDKLIIHR
jgi:hypothetical protein